MRVDNAMGCITKLKLIDTLTNTDIPGPEFAKLVDELIEDNHIKHLILNAKIDRQSKSIEGIK